MSNRKSDEIAVQQWLASQYEGEERYRPTQHRDHYGLRFELQVRVGDTGEEWKTLTRWYPTLTARADAVLRLRQGLGLYGQQRMAGRLRKTALVTR